MPQCVGSFILSCRSPARTGRRVMGIDIFQLPGILLRRWLYVVVTAVLCMVLAMGFVMTRKPVFMATTAFSLRYEEERYPAVRFTDVKDYQKRAG